MFTPRRRFAAVPVIVAAAIAVGLPAAPASASERTTWHLLQRTIATIPTYDGDGVRWVLKDSRGSWARAEWYRDRIVVSRGVPPTYLYSVVVHEWSHLLSVHDYDGDVAAAVRAMNHTFGGKGKTGIRGAEYAADCMALLQGATYTHYTPCKRASWHTAARRLIRGKRL